MAPEQAEGKPSDRSIDVWAFGVVLFEMITGEPPFRGASTQATLRAVMTADPPWERVPPALQPLVRACLERDRWKRLRDVADYRFLLAAPAAAVRARPSPVRPVIAVAVLVAAVLAFFAGQSRSQAGEPSGPASPIRLSTMLPDGVSVTRGPGYTLSVAVSPDGRTIVIAGSDKDGQRLYRRSLDQFESTPIAGSERGSSPFFSWDGKWIAFFADGRIKRMPVDGGAAIEIVVVPGFSSGASWGPDDRIVFAYGADSLLHVVQVEGGKAEPLFINGPPGRQPEVLPNGRTVLFEAAGSIHAYDRQTQAVTRMLPGTAPRYVDGHVIFSRGLTLLAAPLNLQTMSTGTAVPVAAGVAAELPGSGGGRHYAIARNGTLVYVPAADAYEMVVVDPAGGTRVIGQPQRSLENPRFSPDGRSVVVAARRRDDEAADLWLHDLQGGTATRLTSDGGRAAIWNSDGTTITYSHLGERRGIYTTRVNGAGAPVQLLPLKPFHWLIGWTPDRSALLYGVMSDGKGSSIAAHGAGQSREVVEPGSIWGGRLSRDGKWLAYYVLNAGAFEVYVTPFPRQDARWLIAEGTDPSWSPDGREL